MHNQVKIKSLLERDILKGTPWDQWGAPIEKGWEQCVTEWLQLSVTIRASEMVRLFKYVQQNKPKTCHYMGLCNGQTFQLCVTETNRKLVTIWVSAMVRLFNCVQQKQTKNLSLYGSLQWSDFSTMCNRNKPKTNTFRS